jgi:glycosyl transferase family 25
MKISEGFPPIWIINLERSKDRRAKMVQTMDKLGLDFEFVPGVDVSLLTQAEIGSVYRPSAAYDRMGRGLHPNEMACSWAHLRIYEKMIQGDLEELVILEDDIDLAPEFAEVLRTRQLWLPEGWRLVNFAHDMSEPVVMGGLPPSDLAHLNVCRFNRVVGRTGAYMISKEGARSLLGNGFPIRMPPDDLAGDSEFVGSVIHGIVPRVATWDDDYSSTIWEDKTREEFTAASRGGIKGLSRRVWCRIKKLVRGD